MLRRASAGLLALAYVVAVAGCGNKGYDTTCGDFVEMSPKDQRAVVVEEIGEHPDLTTVPRAVRVIVEGCTLEVEQGYPGTTINESS